MGQIDNYLDRISLLKKLTWLITPATKVKNSLNHFVCVDIIGSSVFFELKFRGAKIKNT